MHQAGWAHVSFPPSQSIPLPEMHKPSALVVFALLLTSCDGGLTGGGGRIYAGGGHFGQSIALDGDRVLIGADDTDEAFFLTTDGDGWRTEQRVRIPNGQAPEVLYGWTAGLDGALAAVGAPVFGYEAPGRIYVFERVGGAWEQAAELRPEPPPAGGRESFLGLPIAVSAGRVAAVQSASAQAVTDIALRPAAVRIFERTAAGWEETAELRETATSAQRREGFGRGLALDGDRLAVSSPGREVGGVERAGVVEVYEHRAGAWTLESTLSLPNPRPIQSLGSMGNLSLDGPVLAVGSPTDGLDEGADFGAAYVFREAGGVWALEARLRPPDIGPDNYGRTVAADSGPLGDRVAVGATRRARSRGSVFVWVRRPSGTWELEAELWPADGGGSFGEGLALEGDRLLSGAIGDAGARGGVYEFRLGPAGWRQVGG